MEEGALLIPAPSRCCLAKAALQGSAPGLGTGRLSKLTRHKESSGELSVPAEGNCPIAQWAGFEGTTIRRIPQKASFPTDWSSSP